MLIDEDVPYREGVTLDRPTGKKGSLANCGMRKVTFWKQSQTVLYAKLLWYFDILWTIHQVNILRYGYSNLLEQEVRIDRQLQPGLRVTVKLDTNQTFG